MASRRTLAAGFWIVTGLFALEMLFTAYWEFLQLAAAQAFTRLGFASPAFRLELSVAKLLGVLMLLLPVTARAKEWAYAGFAFNLLFALVAHAAIHDRPASFVPSSVTSVLWALSYFFWRRSQQQPPARTEV